MPLHIESTPIPGLLVVRLDLREDPRGWFKEAWQREKMLRLGLPDFDPVQSNVSWNSTRGTTRGVHTEPWDKFVTLASGRAFAAWVDMREGEGFGTTFHLELDPSVAVFVPRGVGNSYQTLTDDVAYTYLVNEHWRPTSDYPALDLADPAAAIPWPIPLAEATVSEKDRTDNPTLDRATRMPPLRTLVIGSGGQLGQRLLREFPSAVGVDVDTLDLADPDAVEAWHWGDYDLVLNAAAYTAVDAAETPEGRTAAWAVNAAAPAALARMADRHRLLLVHYSTDYVFDGAGTEEHGYAEDAPLAPLGVYAQSKAAGDLAVGCARRHYLLRTSWVIGEGRNFVRTMLRLAADGVSPSVVEDQVGRLTFTDELVRATRHLLAVEAPYGTYHASNGGAPASWHRIAQEVFAHAGRSRDDVAPTTTEAYFASNPASAPRPLRSVLDTRKLEATGFTPRDQHEALAAYCAAELALTD